MYQRKIYGNEKKNLTFFIIQKSPGIPCAFHQHYQLGSFMSFVMKNTRLFIIFGYALKPDKQKEGTSMENICLFYIILLSKNISFKPEVFINIK